MKILYFASLKENLKTSEDDIRFDSTVTILLIKKELIDRYGDQHFPKNILCSVNHEMASENTLVKDED